MTNLIKTIEDHEVVTGTKEWNGKRVYVYLRGFDRSFAGDRNVQVYVDLKTDTLVITRGKGVINSAMQESMEKLAEDFGVTITRV